MYLLSLLTKTQLVLLFTAIVASLILKLDAVNAEEIKNKYVESVYIQASPMPTKTFSQKIYLTDNGMTTKGYMYRRRVRVPIEHVPDDIFKEGRCAWIIRQDVCVIFGKNSIVKIGEGGDKREIWTIQQADFAQPAIFMTHGDYMNSQDCNFTIWTPERGIIMFGRSDCKSIQVNMVFVWVLASDKGLYHK